MFFRIEGFKAFLSLLLILFCSGAVRAVSPQASVDESVYQIKTNLESALTSPRWQRKYDAVLLNMDSLSKKLKKGGAVKSNPVREHYWLVNDLLHEKKDLAKACIEARNRVAGAGFRKVDRAVKSAVTDVSTGVLTMNSEFLPAVVSVGEKDIEGLKQELSRAVSIVQVKRILESHSLRALKSANILQDKKRVLRPVLEQFEAYVTSPFNGRYRGKFNYGEYGGGRLDFTINARMLEGTFDGRYRDEDGYSGTIRAKIRGRVDGKGEITGFVRGAVLMKHPAGRINTKYSFSAGLTGLVKGSEARGEWLVERMYSWDVKMEPFNWSAQKRKRTSLTDFPMNREH